MLSSNMLLLNLILLIDVTFSTPTPDCVNCRSLIAILELVKYNAMFHHRDIVEEIATQRQGEIDWHRS